MHIHSSNELSASAEKLVSKKQFSSAIALLKENLKNSPQYYSEWLLLSKCLFKDGQFKASIQTLQQAQHFDPLTTDFQNIQLYMQRNAFDEATKIALQMLDKHRGHPRAIFTLAHIASVQHNSEKAIEYLLEGIRVSPANMQLRHMLIQNQEVLGDYAEAIDSARSLVGLEENFENLWLLINILLKYGQYSDLFDLCERAFLLANNDNNKQSQIERIKGQSFRILGQQTKGIKALQASLSLNPHNTSAWWALADFKTYQFSDNDISDIKSVLNTQSMPKESKCMGTFALAKASEANNDWNQTMSLYEQANRLHDTRGFDPRLVENEFTARINAYTNENLETQAKYPNDSTVPIFIVGLPRSGSTLLEQMLASHSQIEGTLEQPTFASVERQADMICRQKYKQGLFSKVQALSRDELDQLGQAYLRKGALFRKDNKRFFTDKLPFNFRQVGLIHKILPHAIIIDIRRNPLDCGLSLFKQYFLSGVEFSYDLSHIGLFYKEYLRLMDYWHKSLPGKVLSVQYEDLVNAPQQQISHILEHIGVDFEENCLDFQNTNRIVHTASSEQVRQAINTKGVGAWRQVAKSLTPLKDSLGEVVLEKAKQYIAM